MNGPEEAYLGEAGRVYHEGKRGLAAEAFPWVARARAEKLQPFFKPGDVVFEYGAGAGWNLAALRCAARIACDISDFLAPTLQERGISFIRNSKEQGTESVDALLCHHALEHLLEPAAALSEMRRILKPNGKLLLYVPYEIERRYMSYDPHEPNRHLHSWNVQTLAALVRATGFVVEEAALRRYGYDRAAAAAATKWRLGERGFRFLRSAGQLLRPCWEVQVLARK